MRCCVLFLIKVNNKEYTHLPIKWKKILTETQMYYSNLYFIERFSTILDREIQRHFVPWRRGKKLYGLIDQISFSFMIFVTNLYSTALKDL